jgi:MSHA biogenesis protein MshN
MSLINKMLQDLDARGSQSDEAMQLSVKSVARIERRVPAPLVAVLLGGTLLLAGAGMFGWRYFQRPAPVAAAPARSAVTVLVPPAAAPVLMAAVPAAEPPPAAEVAVPPAAPEPKAAGTTPKQRPGANGKLAAAAKPAPARSAMPAGAASAPAAEGRQMNAQQRAENEYRRAVASLQEGRVAEATGALEQALRLDPRHEAARQTLVGLLIESKREDEAISQLQLGLALDPRQPSMAMLLARLQIEHGASGVDTMMRSLPYAAGNADYRAFLAGALQREQRHREAAEQYQAALRSAPQDAVWLMGLGISLQAEHRNADALDAFRKAKTSGTLSAELLAFVERKLQQLSR